MIQGYPQPEKGKYKVYVRTITYNHSEYIVDTFNGVAMQQTDFPFVHAVYDDCSTDGEQNVIKKWLAENCQMDNAVWYDNELAEIVEVEHNTNHNLTVVVYFFKRNLYKEPKIKRTQYTPWQEACEYEALCEGDDYWIASDKLQKQVDFLDANKDYVMVHSDCIIDYHDENRKERKSRLYSWSHKKRYLDKKNLFYAILKRDIAPQTLTIMFRISASKSIPKNKFNFMMGDTPLYLDLSQLGMIGYLDEVTSVYRKHEGSATMNTNTNKRFNLSMFEMRVYYCLKYNYNIPKKIKIEYNRAYFKLAVSGEKFEAIYPPFNIFFDCWLLDNMNNCFVRRFCLFYENIIDKNVLRVTFYKKIIYNKIMQWIND